MFEQIRISQEKQTLSSEQEICIAIWLDGTDGARSDDMQRAKTELERMGNIAQIFNDVDECVSYVKNNEDRQILLIVSEPEGEKIVSVLHEVKQLTAIYVLSSNRSTNVPWIKKYNKVRSVISSITSICLKLESRKQDDAVEFNFLGSVPTSLTDVDPKNQQDVMFMYGQLLKYVLTEMSYSESDRSEIFEFLRRKYQNPKDIETIREFQCRYDQVDPIQWYTKDCFLYRDLNKALREYDVTFLYSMRVFVKDLHQQIVLCHIKSKESTILKLYRGMIIPTTTFEEMKQKSGRLLSFNCFLSTTTTREVAEMYSGASTAHSDMTPVIFEIDVNAAIITSAHFTDIRNWSQFVDEEEFLFTMGSVFRIQSIEPADDCNAWCIKLLLTDDNDPELTRLTDSIRAQIGTSGVSSFCLLMYLWGKYDKAKEICQLALQTISEDLKPMLSILLVCIDLDIGNHKDAVGLLQSESNFPAERSPISTDNKLAYHRKFLLHLVQGEWDFAIEKIEALFPIETCPTSKPQQESLGMRYFMIGNVRFRQGRYSDALSCMTKAYELLKSYLPKTHPYIADCLQIIAASNSIKGKLDQAFAIVEEVVRIREHSLPPEHQQRVATELVAKSSHRLKGDDARSASQNEFLQTILTQWQFNAANDPNSLAVRSMAYFTANQTDDALASINEYMKTVEENNIHLNETQFGQLYFLTAECYYKRQEPAKAMEFYKKAYESLIQNIGETYPCVANVLYQIAGVYTEQNKFDEAFAVWERREQRPTGISSEDVNTFNRTQSRSIAVIYRRQGVHYQDREQYDDALVSFEKCLEVQKASLPIDYIDIERSHWRIGNNYLIQEKYDDALNSFQESLNIIKVCCPARTTDLARAYTDVAKAFQRLEKFSDALVHFENALKIQLESLSPTDPSIVDTRMSMGFLYCLMQNPDQASSQYSICLEMGLTGSLSPLVKIARGYLYIGLLYEEQQQNEKALSSFRESLKIREYYSPMDPKDFADNYLSIGRVFCNMEKFSDALENFKLAMDFQLQVTSPMDASIANLWARISMLYLKLNDYEQALLALISSYKIKHSEMSMLAIETLSRSVIQGYLYDKRQHPDAFIPWQQFLDFQARSLPADHPDLSNTYRMIGCDLSAKKKHSDAIYNFQRALEIRLQYSSTTDPELAKDYWYLGIEYSSIKQFHEALSNLQMFLSIQTNLLPSYDPVLGHTHITMGYILHQQQKLTEALDHYESASKIFIQALSPANKEINTCDIEHYKCSLANTYGSIGNIHTKLSNFACALQNFQNALDFRLKCASSTSQQIANNWDYLIHTYVAMNNYERALFTCRKRYEVMHSDSFISNVDSFSQTIIRKKYFLLHSLSDTTEHCQRFLEFQMSSLSPNHPHLAPTYVDIGYLLAKQKKFSEALDNYGCALNILLRYLSSTNSAFLEVSNTFINMQLAAVYEKVAYVLWNQGDLPRTLQNFQQALDARLQYLPTTDLVIAQIHGNLGQVHAKLKQNEEALSNFEMALVIQAVSLPPDHLDLVKTHKMIGKILSQQQKFTEALESCECALKILLQTFASANLAKDQAAIKSRNNSLVDIYDLIGDVHWEIGNFSEAFDNYELALDIQLECTSQMHPKAQQIVKKLSYVHRLLV